jgi:hypothetical protein
MRKYLHFSGKNATFREAMADFEKECRQEIATMITKTQKPTAFQVSRNSACPAANTARSQTLTRS